VLVLEDDAAVEDVDVVAECMTDAVLGRDRLVARRHGVVDREALDVVGMHPRRPPLEALQQRLGAEAE